MVLPQQQTGISSQKCEPLDLSVNHNSTSTPPFQKLSCRFHHSKPLDLRVRHHKKVPLLQPQGSEIGKTESFIGAQCRRSSKIHCSLPFDSQISQPPSKCHKTQNPAHGIHHIKSSSSTLCNFVCSEKTFNNSASKSATVNTKELNICPEVPYHTYFAKETDRQTELTDQTCEIQTENIPLSMESINGKKSQGETDNVLNNNDTGHYSTQNIHGIGKSNCNIKRISERVMKRSTVSCISSKQLSAIEENDDIIDKIHQCFEEKSEGAIDTEKNLGQDFRPVEKKIRCETIDSSSQNLFVKPDAKKLKKTGESFIQNGKCFEVAPLLPRCRECSLTLRDSSKKTQSVSDSILCRFYAFRKLRYSSKGFLSTAGFLDPYTDPTQNDLALWQPLSGLTPPHQELQIAKYTLAHVGSQFCDLSRQETEAISIHMSDDKIIAWKRPISGCREMCDVCNTTLFNFHWTCKTCGFAVCIDCYKARKSITSQWMKVERPWLICVNKKAHDQEKLIMTQIIAADSLRHLSKKVHQIMRCLGLSLDVCDHLSSSNKISNDFLSNNNKCAGQLLLMPANTIARSQKIVSKTPDLNREKPRLPCGAVQNGVRRDEEDYLSTFYESLKDKICKPHSKISTSGIPSKSDLTESNKHYEPVRLIRLDDEKAKKVPRIMTNTMSTLLYPDCPHSWLCEGRLLMLSDPGHVGNYHIFQDQWKRGQPVLVNGVLQFLDVNHWQPDSFIRDFGDKKNDLVNCVTGQVIPGQCMCKFWEGFQEVSKMLKDEKGEPMLLKLKDWPPGEDFAEMLPSRFEDLMKALPMGEYTKRTGQLNLPSTLPDYFARPDLGPKMYIAYGSAIHPTKGTTNLHLDISDAVNVMVYVGIPKDINKEEYIKEAYRAIDEACLEVQMRHRVRREMPGALWHIYSARDANKIRHLLSRVARERRIKLGSHQDPIHDQSWYLDVTLRDRLYREYQVKGYAIVQCLGDAIFIPAGAPHQVRNLLNCIKVAEDFVSPENVSHCLHLTQEFRRLSDFHTNHEDKLQIKNIIYHAVKDAVSVLSHYVDN